MSNTKKNQEDLRIRLKYYADEDERQAAEEEYPGEDIPPHDPLPFDRDRLLPAPAFASLRR